MKYLMYISALFLMIACGEQSFEKVDIRLLNSKKSDESNKSVQTIIVDVEQNTTLPKVMDRVDNTVVEPEEMTMVVEDITPVIIPTLAIEKSSNNQELQLAALEEKMKIETLSMQSKHDISIKKLEANKEFSLLELESKEVLAKVDASNRHSEVLAKLASQKVVSSNQSELDRTKSSNEKEIALAKFQTQKDVSKSEEAIALAKLENEKALVDKNIAFYKMIAMLITGILSLMLMIIFFINRRKRKNELQIHEDALRHKEYLEANKMHNEHIKKMLDIITDESADKGVKKEIVRLLKEQGKKGNIIEYKR